MIPAAKLERLLDRYAAIESEMASGATGSHFVKLSREHAELSPVIEAARAYRSTQQQIEDADALIADPEVDAATFRAELGVAAGASVLGLLPGSRPQELRAHAPVMAAAARRLCANRPAPPSTTAAFPAGGLSPWPCQPKPGFVPICGHS